MMVHKLLRLHGDEHWEAWGEDWQDHADVVGELSFVSGWSIPPEWLRERSSRQLDWGSFMYELTLEEVRRLIGPRPDYRDIREDWDEPFRAAEGRQNAMLDSLPADGPSAVVWVEIY